MNALRLHYNPIRGEIIFRCCDINQVCGNHARQPG